MHTYIHTYIHIYIHTYNTEIGIPFASKVNVDAEKTNWPEAEQYTPNNVYIYLQITEYTIYGTLQEAV
jgi:hypothetical protein